MKKKSLLSLFLVLVISLSSFTCLAQSEKKEKVILQKNQEITDRNVLLERAKAGIDESGGKSKLCLKNMSKVTIKNKNTNEEVKLKSSVEESKSESSVEESKSESSVEESKSESSVEESKLESSVEESKLESSVEESKLESSVEEAKLEMYATTQLLESSVEDDITTTTYATTTFANVALTRSDSGSNTGGDIGASSTIYFTESTIYSGGENVDVVKITRATGCWDIYQSGIVLSNYRVQGKQEGWRSPGGAVTDSVYNSPTSPFQTFDYSYSFSTIEQSSLWCMVSCIMKCDWRRGTGSIYSFEFSNTQSYS